MADPTPKRPSMQELAKPDTYGLVGLGSTYTNLLTVADGDSVLALKGQDYRIYREVLRDDQCAASFMERRLAVTAKPWTVEPGGESALDKAAADFIREMLETLEWDRITDKMLYARWYGHAVGECLWTTDGRFITLADIRTRDRGRFLYDDKGGLYLTRNLGTPEKMPERKFWTISTGADHDDAPYGLGLGHFCYWPVFFKRNDIKFWLVYLEKFGQPTAVGKAPAGQLNDELFRSKAMSALKAISSETAVLVPEGMTLEFLEATRSGASDYQAMKEAMDGAITKLIMGQTASSQGTPGKLGNEDQQGDTKADLVRADADLVSASFRSQVLTWLTEWNFPGAKPPAVWRQVEPPDDLNRRAERDAKVFALGYEPTEEYVRETYGDGWQKKAVQTGLDPNKAVQQLAEEFAEVGALATLKAGHRADQQAIVEAATYLANRYPQVIGDRVQGLLDMAEETGDYETMQRHLLELMAEPPPTQTQRVMQRAGTFARLMGMFRQQR